MTSFAAAARNGLNEQQAFACLTHCQIAEHEIDARRPPRAPAIVRALPKPRRSFSHWRNNWLRRGRSTTRGQWTA
jgi:hypothetical protein